MIFILTKWWLICQKDTISRQYHFNCLYTNSVLIQIYKTVDCVLTRMVGLFNEMKELAKGGQSMAL